MADSQVLIEGKKVICRLGLLFSKTQKMLFLALTYWRDIQARLYARIGV